MFKFLFYTIVWKTKKYRYDYYIFYRKKLKKKNWILGRVHYSRKRIWIHIKTKRIRNTVWKESQKYSLLHEIEKRKHNSVFQERGRNLDHDLKT